MPNFIVSGPKFTRPFSPNTREIAVDYLVFRFCIIFLSLSFFLHTSIDWYDGLWGKINDDDDDDDPESATAKRILRIHCAVVPEMKPRNGRRSTPVDELAPIRTVDWSLNKPLWSPAVPSTKQHEARSVIPTRQAAACIAETRQIGLIHRPT